MPNIDRVIPEGRDDLKHDYTRARLAWADHWAERILRMALDDSQDIFYDNSGEPKIDHARIQRHRLQVDTTKWLASKYAPKVYGDKPDTAPASAAIVPARTARPLLRQH
jgi:hypothetical protein